MAERLYFAFDWIVGREFLPVSLAFDLAVKYGIVISLNDMKLLANSFVVYLIGIRVENKKILELWISDIGGDTKRWKPISSDEFEQSFIIFSMDDEGRKMALRYYKSTMSRDRIHFANDFRNGMKLQRLLRKKLRNWHVYTMSWNLPHINLNDPFVEKVNAIVRNMYKLIHEMGGEIAFPVTGNTNKKYFTARFYVVLPSYETLKLFTVKALPTLSMNIWSEISPEDIPNRLNTDSLKYGLYLGLDK